MKKINIFLFTALLSVVVFSCTPQTNVSEDSSPQAIEQDCCGDDSPIPPPPPTGD